MEPLTLLKRGLRHLFRLRWEYRMITEWIDCSCCGGEMGHQLNNATESIVELRRRTRGRNQYTANWVDCRICGATGVLAQSADYPYPTYKRGYCVTSGR